MTSLAESSTPGAAAARGARDRRVAAWLLGLLVALLCWRWFSPSLDDSDSALFLAGVERFSLSEARPHPPGYPIYILLGKLGVLLGLAPRAALALVSCVAAGVCAAWLPRFFAALGFEARPAWALALAVLATPLFELTSCKILTDAAGFAVFLVCATWWLERPRAGGARLGVGVALGLGIRPHGMLLLLPALVARPRRRKLLAFGVALGALVLGVVAVEGASGFASAMSAQATMRFKSPGVSLFSPGTGLAGAPERLMRFQMVFFRDVFGVGSLALKIPATLALLVGGVSLWRRAARFESCAAQRALLAAALGYLLFLFAFLPAHPRYFLPIVPLALASISFGRTPLALLLAALMLPVGFSRVARLQRERAPSELALEWMEQLDPTREIPLVYGPLAGQARVQVPGRGTIAPRELAQHPAAAPPLLFAPRNEARELLAPAGPGYTVRERAEFRRGRELHDKGATVEMLLLERREP